ncbi:MAG: hypothetical protein ACREV8_12155 [Gammaproteobacteria bacterium]
MGGGKMRFLILAVLAATLTGCPFAGVTQLNRIPEGQPLGEPELFNRPGILTHDATGLAFPEWYDNFQRVTAYRYDSAGLNVGIGYNDRRSNCLVVATFYIYPAPRMSYIGAAPNVVASVQARWLDDEFGRSKAEIHAAHPGLREISISPTIGPTGASFVQGPRFRFAAADQQSELHLFLYARQWFLKYRFTYPQSCESDARAALSALTRQLPWAAAQGTAADER